MKSLHLLLTLQLLLLPLICIVASPNAAAGRFKELQEFRLSKLASIKDSKRRTAEAVAKIPIQTPEKNATTPNKSRHILLPSAADNTRLKRRITSQSRPKLRATAVPKGRPRLLRRVTKITPLGKRQIVPGATSSLTDRSKSTSDDQIWLNRTYKAQLMKQRYFKFRSLLPGGGINKEDHSPNEHGRTRVTAETQSSSLVTRLQGISRGNIRRVSSIVLKEQRSAGENTGSTISGQLKKFQQPFVSSDAHLQFSSDSNISPEHFSSNSSSVESITRLLAKRLGPSARNTYDPSILVDFLALVALNRQPTSIRQIPDDIPGPLISTRRRGGDPTRRLSQRTANFGLPNGTESASEKQPANAQAKELRPGTTASHQHDRATSSLEAPLLFSTSELGPQKELTRDQDFAQTQPRENSSTASITTENISNPLTGMKGSSEFGPFSDGNDQSAGVSPPALPPVLKASLYNYLVPRLMYLAPLTETIPGVPGLDYPIMSTVPYTNFYCTNMPWPGFYADTEARCQAWHMCDLDGRQASFLCPNGTIFNQAFMVCDWWYNSDCQAAPYLYPLNERLFQQPELPPPTQQHRTLTAQVLDTLFL